MSLSFLLSFFLSFFLTVPQVSYTDKLYRVCDLLRSPNAVFVQEVNGELLDPPTRALRKLDTVEDQLVATNSFDKSIDKEAIFA